MSVIKNIKQYLKHRLPAGIPVTEAEAAYDLWAGGYDHQPQNLMLALDNELFEALLKEVTLKGSHIIDVGCGTGRHWTKMLAHQPAEIVGYDISREMLSILKEKFPGKKVFRQTSHLINQPDNRFDLLVSTLTIAHISNMVSALQEWCRVTKPGGSLVITDYHPSLLQKGGQRTFFHDGRLIAIKNHIHPVEYILDSARQLGMEVVQVIEREIDKSMRTWYEKQHAEGVYEKFKGTPVIYGCHLKKKDAVK